MRVRNYGPGTERHISFGHGVLFVFTSICDPKDLHDDEVAEFLFASYYNI